MRPPSKPRGGYLRSRDGGSNKRGRCQLVRSRWRGRRESNPLDDAFGRRCLHSGQHFAPKGGSRGTSPRAVMVAPWARIERAFTTPITATAFVERPGYQGRLTAEAVR